MSIGLLGNKIGMTQIFDESGNIIPVTILKVGPCVITQVKTKVKDGYDSIQIGYGNISGKGLNQPQLGHLQKSKIQPLKYLKEFRINTEEKFEVGKALTLDSILKFETKEEIIQKKGEEEQTIKRTVLSPGQLVNIRGKSIGKGFSGLQKRHNFTRGPMTHGSKNHRAPGSIGMGTTPGRVLPGKKMAGQLGNKITTVQKLKVIQVNLEEHILVIKGSVPGKPGNLLSIVPSE